MHKISHPLKVESYVYFKVWRLFCDLPSIYNKYKLITSACVLLPAFHITLFKQKITKSSTNNKHWDVFSYLINTTPILKLVTKDQITNIDWLFHIQDLK